MKIIKYQLATEINYGTPEEPDIETVLSGVTMPSRKRITLSPRRRRIKGRSPRRMMEPPRRLPQPRSSCGRMWISWRPCRGWRCDSV